MLGYDEDSSLLVFVVYKKGKKGQGAPLHYIIIDGNIRLRAVAEMDEVESVPCRVISLEEGIKD